VTAYYRVRAGGSWIEVPVASLGGEALVVTNVAALTVPDRSAEMVLLQRRDKEGEVVRGRLEVPSGRWRAGETAEQALRREVAEETGLEVLEVLGSDPRTVRADPERPFHILEPAAVTVGVAGAYPALHLAFLCVAPGNPLGRPGETADPRWCPLAEVHDLLAEPGNFTGATLGILIAWLNA
jgi:8-oxo-dGTP pyrophosphatase MutT (NUDIX family)